MYLRDKNGRVAQPDPTHSDKGVIFASGIIETAKLEQLDHNTYIALLPRDFEHLHFVSKYEEGRLGDLVMCTIDRGRQVFVLLKGGGSDESSSTLIREY